jgi:hypothetical protein
MGLNDTHEVLIPTVVAYLHCTSCSKRDVTIYCSSPFILISPDRYLAVSQLSELHEEPAHSAGVHQRAFSGTHQRYHLIRHANYSG